MGMRHLKGSVTSTLLVIFAIMALFIAGFVYKMMSPRILTPAQLRGHGGVVLDTPRKFSDFKLVDQQGKPFTQDNLKGKWTLLFFGFTHCPDICPITMAQAAKMYKALNDSDKQDLQIVLISLDHERDTPEKMAEYVTYFHPDFVGATGNQYVLLKLATELNVAYSKVSLEGDNYTIDHSGNMVLINPYGHYHGFLKPPFEYGSMKMAWRSIKASFKD